MNEPCDHWLAMLKEQAAVITLKYGGEMTQERGGAKPPFEKFHVEEQYCYGEYKAFRLGEVRKDRIRVVAGIADHWWENEAYPIAVWARILREAK
jgi:hypothetical protein